jgi:hypothetical protein
VPLLLPLWVSRQLGLRVLLLRLPLLVQLLLLVLLQA